MSEEPLGPSAPVLPRPVGLRIEGHAQVPGLPSPFNPSCLVQLPSPECLVHTLTVGATPPARPVSEAVAWRLPRERKRKWPSIDQAQGRGRGSSHLKTYRAAFTVLEGLPLSLL